MKSLLIISLHVLSATFCIAQQQKEFEGKIYYKQELLKWPEGWDSAKVASAFGSESILSYKNGKIRWDIGSDMIEYQISAHQKLLTVFKYRNIDSLYKLDYSKRDSLLTYKLTSNADTICGYVCDKLETTYQNTDGLQLKRTLWFNRSLYCNPASFKNARSYGDGKVMEIMQSFSLGMVVETDIVTLRFTATRVQKESIPDAILTPDKSLPLSKNAFPQ